MTITKLNKTCKNTQIYSQINYVRTNSFQFNHFSEGNFCEPANRLEAEQFHDVKRLHALYYLNTNILLIKNA